MRSVMTLWSAPRHAIFQRHRVVQLALAANLARYWHSPLILFTDPEGAAALEPFGIPFDEIDVRYLPERLCAADARIWCLGKIAAYEAMSRRGEPFMHVDADVFLFRPLPDRIQKANIFAQSPEKFYRAEGPGAERQHFRWVYRISDLLKLPELSEEARIMAHRVTQVAVNMGCFGGCDLETIAAYAREVLGTFCDSAKNRVALDELFKEIDSFFFTCVVEQWMIGPALLRRKTGIDYLIAQGAHFWTTEAAKVLGYAHFWGRSKDEQPVIEWVDAQLRWRDPALLERINARF